jgi:Cu(I)/Ag(I) efflux system membrane fusion protein
MIINPLRDLVNPISRFVLVLGLLLASQLVLAQSGETAKSSQGTDQTERKVLYWVAPMDPNYRRDKPGKSPMGMDLIPVYADEMGEGGHIAIDPQMVQNLGIRIAPVERGRLWRAIRAPGFVTVNRNAVREVEVRFAGWIQDATVQEAGETVEAGQRLFSVYSPELNSAQRDFLQILSSGNPNLIRAAEQRLRALGMQDVHIRQLKKRKKIIENLPVFSPISGVIASTRVREGAYIKPGMPVMRLEPLDSVWLMLQAPERKAELIRPGLPVDFQLATEGSDSQEGTIEYVYPVLDKKTRSVTARLTVANAGYRIKPGQLAHATIYAGPKDNILYVPSEAVIRLGDENRVIVSLGEGKFAARTVGLGIESGDYTEISWGLEEDDKVVVSGQFLLDSEASFKASMMRAAGADSDADNAQSQSSGDQ